MINNSNTFPKNVPPEEISIDVKPPLFRIDLKNINENGVIVNTETPILLKQGKKSIQIKKETLQKSVDYLKDKMVSYIDETDTFIINGVAVDGDTIRNLRYPNQKEIINTVNKNAYEIRSLILEKAIEIVKTDGSTKSIPVDMITEKVLEVAKKLYQFVENKHN